MDQQSAAQTARRLVLLCQQGLSDRVTGWDKGLFSLCERAEAHGFELVYDGAYPAFGALDEGGAYAALFETLDTNEDGLVDAGDEPSSVYLVGFSWGGVNINEIAYRLSADPHTAPGYGGVAVMVLLDAYQPFYADFDVPLSVHQTWSYRQTKTQSDDCSHDISFGYGYRGLKPHHHPEALGTCRDLDLERVDPGVGHCGVVNSAADAVFHNLTTRRSDPSWSKKAQPCPQYE
ncbi:MAG: hypothetical protein AAF928_15165 [Myxococcota bacterium]